MDKMISFYRDVLGFDIKDESETSNVYLIKDGVLFLLYRRCDFEDMTKTTYEYTSKQNGHFEIALEEVNFESVDKTYKKVIEKGAVSIMPPTTEPWGQRTCYIADPEGNLIEIGSFQKE